MPPLSTSTRTPSAGTNKMSITCGYLPSGGPTPTPTATPTATPSATPSVTPTATPTPTTTPSCYTQRPRYTTRLLLRHDQHRRLERGRRRELVLLRYRGPVPDSRVIGDSLARRTSPRRPKADDPGRTTRGYRPDASALPKAGFWIFNQICPRTSAFRRILCKIVTVSRYQGNVILTSVASEKI